jgi:CRISPR/Cas system-associated endonuclease Cas1
MRRVLPHRMSPTHGFLHEPTDYPSLVYDLT